MSVLNYPLYSQSLMLVFRAIVSSRSSVNAVGGPPGEKQLLAGNHPRKETILKLTGWDVVYPGTLNLEVTDDTVHQLLLCCEIWKEPGSAVNYPEPYRSLPAVRVGYLYYTGEIRYGSKTASVLFRRACNPLPGVIDTFSSINLRDYLGLKDGDLVGGIVDPQS